MTDKETFDLGLKPSVPPHSAKPLNTLYYSISEKHLAEILKKKV